MRAVIVLPNGASATSYSYRVDYSLSLESNIVLAPATFDVTGVTVSSGIDATAA